MATKCPKYRVTSCLKKDGWTAETDVEMLKKQTLDLILLQYVKQCDMLNQCRQ